jgi:hypothetical protein
VNRVRQPGGEAVEDRPSRQQNNREQAGSTLQSVGQIIVLTLGLASLSRLSRGGLSGLLWVLEGKRGGVHAVKKAAADRGAVLGLLKPWDLTWATFPVKRFGSGDGAMGSHGS